MEKKKGKLPPDPALTKEFAKNLKSCIKTNESLAEKVGVSPQAVADYVNGISIPRGDILLKISKVTEKSMQWLLTGEEKPGEFAATWPEDIRNACQSVHKIMTSDFMRAKEALKSSLSTIEDHIDLGDFKKELEHIKKKLKVLEELHGQELKSGNGRKK